MEAPHGLRCQRGRSACARDLLGDQAVANPACFAYALPTDRWSGADAVLTVVMVEGVTNPVVIIEVLSESTERYDREEKFGYYRTLPSLQEFVLVDRRDGGTDGTASGLVRAVRSRSMAARSRSTRSTGRAVSDVQTNASCSSRSPPTSDPELRRHRVNASGGPAVAGRAPSRCRPAAGRRLRAQCRIGVRAPNPSRSFAGQVAWPSCVLNS